jgi:hypothetical protein
MATASQQRLVEVEVVEGPADERAPVGADKSFRAYDPDQVVLMGRCCASGCLRAI